MELTTIKLFFAILILITTITSGWYPFKKRIKTRQCHDYPLGEALASGVFLGAGLVHMLGDSARAFFSMNYDYPLAFSFAGISFLLLLLLEHIGRELYKNQNGNSQLFAITAVVMLSFHSFLEGAALGLSDNISIVILILIAIIAHKWAASFSLAVHINKSSLKPIIGIIAFAIFTVMTPLGIVTGNFALEKLGQYPLLTPTFTALAAGTFLYLGTLHGLDKAVMIKQCCNLKYFSFVILGFSIMAILAIWC